LAALEDAIDGVGDRLEALTRVAGAGGADQAGTSLAAAREQLEAGAEAQRADLSALADGVRDDVETALGQLQHHLATLSRGIQDGLGEGMARLEDRAATLTVQGQTAALEPLVEGAREAVSSVMADVRAVVADQRQQLAGLRGDVQLVADRLVGAGQALVEHLAGRDLRLERARDELAGRLLADLLTGLPARERETAVRRAAGLLQRRRETRDATRWREGMTPEPNLPAEVADEDELLRLIDARRPAAATSAATPAAPTTEFAPLPDAVIQAAPRPRPAKRAPAAARPAAARPTAAGQPSADPGQPTKPPAAVSGPDSPAPDARTPPANAPGPEGGPRPSPRPTPRPGPRPTPRPTPGRRPRP
jgi:hypothetical protein